MKNRKTPRNRNIVEIVVKGIEKNKNPNAAAALKDLEGSMTACMAAVEKFIHDATKALKALKKK
jgi:hypothetical protein